MSKEGISRREMLARAGQGVLLFGAVGSLGVVGIERLTEKTLEEKVAHHTKGFERMRDEIDHSYNTSKATLAAMPFPLVESTNALRETYLSQGMDPSAGKFTSLEANNAWAAAVERKYAPLNFAGGVETRKGIKINFWQIVSKDQQQLTIDPKAVDAYTSWIYDHLQRYQQIALHSDQQFGEDAQNFQSLLNMRYSDGLSEDWWAPNECVLQVIVNTDRKECFSKSDEIVAEKNNQCRYLGIEIGDAPNIPIIITYTNEITTQPTRKDSWLDRNGIDLKSKNGEATNPLLCHEYSHALARIAGLIWEKDTDTDKYPQEHKQLVNPIENAFVAFFAESKKRNQMPPLPLSFS